MTLPNDCCDYEDCEGEPVGYISRICHGPTYCAEHEDWAWEEFRRWAHDDEDISFTKWLDKRKEKQENEQ